MDLMEGRGDDVAWRLMVVVVDVMYVSCAWCRGTKAVIEGSFFGEGGRGGKLGSNVEDGFSAGVESSWEMSIISGVELVFSMRGVGGGEASSNSSCKHFFASSASSDCAA